MHRALPLVLALAACGPDPALQICPDYSGLDQVGAERTYESNDNWEANMHFSRTWVRTVASAEVDGDVAEVVVEHLWDDTPMDEGGEAHQAWASDRYRCDAEGLWLVHRHFENDDGMTHDLAYSEPPRELSADPHIGEEWVSKWTSQAESEGGSETYSGERVYRIKAEEILETPAGSFDTLLVEQTGDGQFIEQFLDPAIGVVRTGMGLELVDL